MYKRQLKYNIIKNKFLFNSFMSVVTKHGKKHKIVNIFTCYYKFILMYFNSKFNMHFFYMLFINNIFYNLLPMNALKLNKINKKKKKNARLKSKYENSISYLIPNKRLNFVYKWLKIDVIIASQYSIKSRIYNILNHLYFNNTSSLLIFILKKKLHNLMLINFLKKKNK